MKVRSFYLIILSSLLPIVCPAQDLNSKILMTIGEKKIEAGEFIRMYRKSADPQSNLDIDNYVQEFINFKLKVADAISEGDDTTRSFRNELSGYRNQLAENYLTDTQAKDKLLEKAYKRSLTEINVWHILIAMPENVSPDDTMKQWKKAIDIRERIVTGEPFESVARGTSDDNSVKINGGNLGYISAFQMIMPFEDAAYSLKPGTISMPVRTPYGYHIISVTDRRQSKGRIKVAHIMKSLPPGTSDEDAKMAEADIINIYKMLNQGASFSELARKYSDHKESAVRGGELDWFGTGEIISDFSEPAFALADTGKYTKPIRTLYGWHIIKLLGRKTPGTFDEAKPFLESKINQSYLKSLSKKQFVEKIKKEYNFKINREAFNWFITNTDTLIIQGLKKYDPVKIPDSILYSFANQKITSKDFANFVEKKGFMVVTKDSSVFINRLIDIRVTDDLINYENSRLEKKYPEFRYLMDEFHDVILLFDISGKKVWNKMSNDSSGLKSYYEENKNNWLSRKGIETKLYTLKMTDGNNLLLEAFKKYSDKPDFDEILLKKFNRKNDTLLFISQNRWFKGDNSEIDKLDWQTGQHPFNKDGFPSVIVIKKVIDPSPLKFNEVQSEVVAGYQESLEKDWIRQLNKKYNVKIDNMVLEEVKKKLKK